MLLGGVVAWHANALRASCEMKCGIWTWIGPCLSIGMEWMGMTMLSSSLLSVKVGGVGEGGVGLGGASEVAGGDGSCNGLGGAGAGAVVGTLGLRRGDRRGSVSEVVRPGVL